VLFNFSFFILFLKGNLIKINKKEKESKRKLFEKYSYKKINLIKKKIVKNKKII
jgi:hypothetical protein